MDKTGDMEQKGRVMRARASLGKRRERIDDDLTWRERKAM